MFDLNYTINLELLKVKGNSMKKNSLIFFLFLFMSSSNAIELVCKGQQQRDRNQRAVMVDCSNRKEVIEYLESSWLLLRRERIGGQMEEMCWKPYQQAEGIHPSISFNSIASTFFAQCNMGLSFIK
jgi:hypothetical protein